MCGICGKVTFAGAEVDPALLARMCERLMHRGPDDQGIKTMPGAGLAQRRLSIIDLSPEAVAPQSNEDGSVWVTFNGEIYNFQELRAELTSRGHVFRTATDTEVVVHLYEEHDVGCLSRLHGMFALAIWDARHRRLFAARDRFGKKPFFYAGTPRGLVFASTIGALLVDSDVSSDPNYRALDDYLTYQYVPSPQTAFVGINKLPPAHYLTCTRGGTVEVARYWRPPAPGSIAQRMDGDQLEQELLDRLSEAVRTRLIADVPLGAFLSGGIDSSAVVALMARAASRPVKTFAVGFEEQEFNELPFARAIARRYATDHHEYVVRAEAAAILPDLVRHFGEPFADASAVPTYYVSKMTRQHVTVALSGDGGDENFAGYENYRIVCAWHRADVVPAAARRAVSLGLGDVVRRFPYGNTTARLSRASTMFGSGVAERFGLQSSILKPEEKREAYTPRFRALVSQAPAAPCGPASLGWTPGVDALDWMMWHDLQFYLPDCLMVKVDVASMANSLEVRSPFLDHRFVEFASGIPSELKRDASGGKSILKRALAGLLPEEILGRPKQGFGLPLRRWFDGDLLELLKGNLLDTRATRRGLFVPSFVNRLIDDQTSGRRDWSHRLWALLWLELWFREFID